MDLHCTGTKEGKSLVFGVQQAQTAPRRKARRADEATAIAISPRPLERPGGACELQGGPSGRTPGILVPVNCNTRSRKRQYVDAGPPCQRRTRWLAGPASRNRRNRKKKRGSQRPQKKKPSLRAGVARRGKKGRDDPSSARWLRQEPFDERSARMKCHWRAFFELPDGCG